MEKLRNCKSDIGVVGFKEPHGVYNIKYPPNYEKYGTEHEGYRTWKEEELFFLFAVQGNDMHIEHNGKDYHFLSTSEFVAESDDHYTKVYKKYKNANELIENFEIEGRKLVDIVNDLDFIEWI